MYMYNHVNQNTYSGDYNVTPAPDLDISMSQIMNEVEFAVDLTVSSNHAGTKALHSLA